MRSAAFETCVPASPITSLPARLEQSGSWSSALLVCILAFPALAFLAPFVFIALHALGDGQVLIERIETTVLAIIGAIAWGLMFGWPIGQRLARVGWTREIVIANGVVQACDRTLLGKSTWREPLDGYRGLAHHVRASLSGTRHELFLIHSDATRTILVREADRIGQAEIDALVQLLGCREIAPQVYYRHHKPSQSGSTRAARPGLISAEA